MLGICYGMQLIALELGGRVEGAEVGEFGRSQLTVTEPGRLLAGTPAEQTCWMSHRDTVFAPPPAFDGAGVLDGVAGGGVRVGRARRLRDPVPPRGRPHALRPAGADQLPRGHLRLRADLERGSVIEEQIERIRAQVGDGRAICGLSGGVDSSVAALLVHRAIGDRLTCVFVDHGLMRKNEGEQVIAAFRDHFKVPLVAVDAADRFLARLAGVTDPEEQAQADRRRVHPRVRGGGRQARRRPLPRPGHALLRRDRVRRRHRRGDDQVPSQRRRAARRPRVRARRAAADAVQGRGPRGRRRARPARAARLAPAVPGTGPRDPDRRRRGDARAAGHRCARPTRSSRTRSARPASTASCGSRSASCPTSAPSASRATSARTAT